MVIIIIYKDIEMYISISTIISIKYKTNIELGNDMIVFYIAKCDLSTIKVKVVDHTIEEVG